MKKIIIIFSILTFFISGALFYWFNSAPDREMRRFNRELFDQVVKKIKEISNNPKCPSNHYEHPIDGRFPECNSAMVWIEDDKTMAMHLARLEYLVYKSNRKIDRPYLNSKIAEYFNKRGFQVDQVNTRTNDSWKSGNQIDYYYSYRKDNLYCSVVLPQLYNSGLSTFMPPYLEVVCGQSSDSDRQIYIEFSPLINPDGESNSIFWLEARDGNYARIGIRDERQVWSEKLLYKKDEKWTVIFGDNLDYQFCYILDRLGFPKSIYRNCMLPDYSLRDKIDSP